MGRSLIFLIILQTAIAHSFAEDIKFKHLWVDQGLSRNDVRCIYQDSKGYMWFGTEDGLNRFDGYAITIFRNIFNDTTSISDNNIVCILEDHAGNLWIGTENGGLNKFNRETGKFTRYLHRENDKKSLINNKVWSIYEDRSRTLWISSYGEGINVYQPKTDDFKRIVLDSLSSDRIERNTISNFFEDHEGLFWMATDGGLYLFNRKNATYKLFKFTSENYVLANGVFKVTEDTMGILWLISEHGLIKWDKNSKTIIHIYRHNNHITGTLPSDKIYDIVKENQYLWLATQNGLSKFDKTTQQFLNFTHDPNNPTSLSNKDIIRLYEDRSGTLWVGTRLNGIDMLEQNTKFTGALDGRVVDSFCEDTNNDLWIGSFGEGLFRYDQHKHLHIFTYNKNNPNSISGNYLSTLFQYHADTLWAGTSDAGLNRITWHHNNRNKINVKHLLGTKEIKSILEDAHHRLWIGCDDDWYLYYPDKDKFVSFRNDPHNPNSIISTNVQTAIIDKSTGDIWIATWNGLSRMILPKDGLITSGNVKFINFTSDPKNTNSIADNRIISLCRSKNGVLWAGTYGSGFDKIVCDDKNCTDVHKYTIKHYSEKNGLPNNVVYGILNDNHGYLWISTNRGLAKFDPVTEHFTTYDIKDGLLSNQFYWRAYYKGPSGKMYFGGANGYITFFPDRIRYNPDPPPVYITGFSLFNKLQEPGAPGSPLQQEICGTKKITISYKQSVISFEYVALNYITTEKNVYAYQLEGFDAGWQQAGSQRKVTYTNLDPGTYVFRVKGANNDGVWNENGASLILVITPPFWKTIWFRILFSGLLIASFFSFYYTRMTRIRKKNVHLQQLVAERTLEIKKKNEALLEHAEILNTTNTLLEKRQREIEEKNILLTNQSETLSSTNTLLEERQQQIEEQSEELKAQRDQLGQLNLTKDKLFSILAHDLRNPFNVIIGFSELLVNDFQKLSEEKIKKFLGLIHTSSIRGNELLENILQWSRTQTGRISFEPEEQNLSKIAEEIKSLLEGSAQQKDITINQLISPEVVVIADENMLKTIFRNLISNAIKFTPEKGSISLKSEISIDSAYVEVSVSDTGVGIPENTLKNLFRVDTTVTTKGTAQESGTGLGLIICKEFVEKHRGKIWVQSQVNSGTTFYFTLHNKQNSKVIET